MFVGLQKVIVELKKNAVNNNEILEIEKKQNPIIDPLIS